MRLIEFKEKPVSRIVIVLDLEAGHLFPTFQLARNLADRGHEVVYLGSFYGTCGPSLDFAAAGNLVRSQGFQFIPFFNDEPYNTITRTANPSRTATLFGPLVRGTLDELVEGLKPDVFLTLTIFVTEALAMRYRYKIPVVLLRTHCSLLPRKQLTREIVTNRLMNADDGVEELIKLMADAGIAIKRLIDVADAALEMPEFVLLPGEFAPRGYRPDDSCLYVGAGLPPSKVATSEFQTGPRLVYCSLGSQSDLHHQLSLRFFHLAIVEISKRSDLEMLLSTGRGIHLHELGTLPSNVRVTEWAPQREVLLKSEIMITHGGLGTVKECISMGVPMVVVPVMRDQFEVAGQVVEHDLGLQADFATVTGDTLISLIDRVMNVPLFKSTARAMSGNFRRPICQEAFQIIEDIAVNRKNLNCFGI
jgi:zeaxanthin glucosyltransferase